MTRVVEIVERLVRVAQSDVGVPVQLRPGGCEGEVVLIVDHRNIGVTASVRIEDLRTALDLVEAMDE